MPGARGGRLDDAQDNAAKAYNDFYWAFRNGSNKSPEEAGKLRKQIVIPAAAKVQRTVGDIMRENFNLDAKTGVTVQAGKEDPRPAKEVPAKEEILLDGSNIQKELQFRGKGKNAVLDPDDASGGRAVVQGEGDISEVQYGGTPAKAPVKK